jgi:hypothetical protein
MIALDHLGAFAPLVCQLERRLKEVHVQAPRRIQPRHHCGGLDAVEAAIADKPAHNGAVFLLHERRVIFYARERVTSIVWARHHGTTTSFMKALSLSKSAPRMSHCAATIMMAGRIGCLARS